MVGRREGFFPLAEWFHVKHQSPQQLVGEGRHTPSHPQPTTFHVKHQQKHEAMRLIQLLGNAVQPPKVLTRITTF